MLKQMKSWITRYGKIGSVKSQMIFRLARRISYTPEKEGLHFKEIDRRMYIVPKDIEQNMKKAMIKISF